MRRVSLPITAVIFALTGSLFVANAGGTQGLATPEVVNPDNSGLFVGEVFLLVTAGWINAPHAVSATITSDNLVIGERHGEQAHALADLEVIGDILQGQAIVRVPWTTDTNPTSATHLYEVCAHVIFADKQAGNESCGDFTL